MQQPDDRTILVIGGAIMGTTLAYWLKHAMQWPGTVTVIERDPTYAQSATTLSAASIRQQFSTPENIAISQMGIRFLRALGQNLQSDTDIALREHGYLITASQTGLPILMQNAKTQRQAGADIVTYDQAGLVARFPWFTADSLAASGLLAGNFGQTGEGWFDAYALLMGLRQTARRAGAAFVTGEVRELLRTGDHITGAKLSDGTTLTANIIVNAAGPQAGLLATSAGLELPVEPRKRTVHVFKAKTEMNTMPLTVLPSGTYIRPEGDCFICGRSPEADRDGPAEPDDFTPDYQEFEQVIWPDIATAIPAFESLRYERAWAGHYDYNPIDQNAILGRHPHVENLYLINGFSGHGLQQAPACARALAELIVHGRYQSLDLTCFRPERFAENAPVRELNVI